MKFYQWKTILPAVVVSFFLSFNCIQAQEDPDSFTLNLKNADIHALIEMVSKSTGKNFIVDPRVKAKITVISSEPINAKKLYEVFISVLQVHGYSTVQAGDMIKILPDGIAKQSAIPVLTE